MCHINTRYTHWDFSLDCLNSFYAQMVHYQSEIAFPWMRDMTGHWTVLYYISYWMYINQLYMLKRLSPAVFHTHVPGWESTPCSLTCQFSKGPWKQHSRERPIRAPIGLRPRATPMGGLLIVSKKCPGTLVILGSVVRSTHNLYERFWYGTQSAPDTIIWTLLLLLQASLKKVYQKPKRRDFGLFCMYVFSDLLSVSNNKALSNHKSVVRVIR